MDKQTLLDALQKISGDLRDEANFQTKVGRQLSSDILLAIARRVDDLSTANASHSQAAQQALVCDKEVTDELRLAELVSDLEACKASNRQAWGICDAVAEALGDDLDREAGSAASVARIRDLLSRQSVRDAEPDAWGDMRHGRLFTDKAEAENYHENCYDLTPLFKSSPAQAAQHVEQDKKDAERYRYLRNEAWGCDKRGRKDVHVCQFGPGVLMSAVTELAEEALDEAIDAAIQQGGKDGL